MILNKTKEINFDFNFRCNGIKDCYLGEDEVGCEDLLCPGYFRCLNSKVCLHGSHLCDGVTQCPLQEDERFCNLHCPSVCTCQGFEYTCSKPFQITQHSNNLRYLDASGSGFRDILKENLPFLVYLNVSNCNIKYLFHLQFPNLRELDLSNNPITIFDSEYFQTSQQIYLLHLINSSVHTIEITANTSVFKSLDYFDISWTKLKADDVESFKRVMPRVRTLKIASVGLTSVLTLSMLPNLKEIDLTGNEIEEVDKDVFQNLNQLQRIISPTFKLCCRQLIPLQVLDHDCLAPTDEFSSCENLLRSDLLRSFLWLFAVVSLVGNAACFIVRLKHQKGNKTGS